MLAQIESDDRVATEMRAKNYAAANPTGWLNGDFKSADGGDLDLRAVGLVETGGKHRNADGSIVTSPKGAQGEFQLMPGTGKELAAKEVWNITLKIQSSMRNLHAIMPVN